MRCRCLALDPGSRYTVPSHTEVNCPVKGLSTIKTTQSVPEWDLPNVRALRSQTLHPLQCKDATPQLQGIPVSRRVQNQAKAAETRAP